MQIEVNESIINEQVEQLANARADSIIESRLSEERNKAIVAFYTAIVSSAVRDIIDDEGDTDHITDDEYSDIVQDILREELANEFDPAGVIAQWMTNGSFETIVTGKIEEIVANRAKWYTMEIRTEVTATIRVKANSEDDAIHYVEYDLDPEDVEWDFDNSVYVDDHEEDDDQSDDRYARNSADITE